VPILSDEGIEVMKESFLISFRERAEWDVVDWVEKKSIGVADLNGLLPKWENWGQPLTGDKTDCWCD